VDVPKNDRSVRPGSTLPIIDSIYLYAIAQRLAPLLDPLLCDCAYAWRLNPSADRSGEPLFSDRSQSQDNREAPPEGPFEDSISDTEDQETEFPYDWFANWILFHAASRAASLKYEHVAVTDIVAYFENISLDVLREQIKERLEIDEVVKELIDRLFRLLEFWAWSPEGILPRAFGLPQGNNVSSFLSNIYLVGLDQEMLDIVNGDTTKYFRYVDDIRLYTSDRDEARMALVKLERVLRSLDLNVQTAKTKVDPASEAFNAEAEFWLDRMREKDEQAYEYAVEFFDDILPAGKPEDLQRPYLRCLTVLRIHGDARAVPVALASFLASPSYKLLSKQFTYLRSFVGQVYYSADIVQRLNSPAFTFPYHRAFMYRLGSYCRDDSADLRSSALSEAMDVGQDWFVRMSALYCLHTFDLAGDELAAVGRLIESEPHPQVARGAFLALFQHAGRELEWVGEKLSLFNAPHQEYLRRYFRRLRTDEGLASKVLAATRLASVNAPNFISMLHKLDILKSRHDTLQRTLFSHVIEEKINDAQQEEWPRLSLRLSGIRKSFVLKP
jgi:hypothetical protein